LQDVRGYDPVVAGLLLLPLTVTLLALLPAGVGLERRTGARLPMLIGLAVMAVDEARAAGLSDRQITTLRDALVDSKPAQRILFSLSPDVRERVTDAAHQAFTSGSHHDQGRSVGRSGRRRIGHGAVAATSRPRYTRRPGASSPGERTTMKRQRAIAAVAATSVAQAQPASTAP
jgi:hypothetical protein